MRKSARKGRNAVLRINCVTVDMTKDLALRTPVSKLLLSLASYRPWTIYFNPSKFYSLIYKIDLLYIVNVFIVSHKYDSMHKML